MLPLARLYTEIRHGYNIVNHKKDQEILLRRTFMLAYENQLHQALLSAIEKDELPEVKKLFSSLRTPIGQGTLGDTALIWAAKCGASRCVAFFLSEGVDVNIRGKLGMTALIWAAYYNRLDCVRLLLDNKANVNTKNEAGDTALMWAAKRGAIDCVGILLDNGANLNIRGKLGMTALMWAAYYNRLDCVRLLLDNGANLNIRGKLGMTALIWAAYCNHAACVTLLLKNKADKEDVNIQNEQGDTALMWAAKRGARDCVGILLDNGANLNTENEAGDTALMMAAFHGYTAIAKTLVEHGSHLLYKDEFGDTSIDIAVGEHRWNTAIELLRWVAKKAANEQLPSPNDCLSATNKYILQVKLFKQPRFACIPEQFQPAVFDYLLTAEPRQLELINKINEQDDHLKNILLDMQLYLIGKSEAARLNPIINRKYNFIALLLEIVATAPDPDPLTAIYNKIIDLETREGHIEVYCCPPYKPWRSSKVKKFVGQLKKLYQDTKNQDRSFDDSIELVATVCRHSPADEHQPLLQSDSNTGDNSY
jgi:uncharacterized protein